MSNPSLKEIRKTLEAAGLKPTDYMHLTYEQIRQLYGGLLERSEK